MLAPYAEEIVSAGSLGLPEPEETGDSFAANALIKARGGAQHTGCITLADDSGLCVEALGGSPGIYSARWAGPEKDFLRAMRRINSALDHTSSRAAAFVCTLVLAAPQGEPLTVEGRVEGRLIWPPRGTKGHGYDPIFVPEGETRTFAEMDDAEKNLSAIAAWRCAN